MQQPSLTPLTQISSSWSSNAWRIEDGHRRIPLTVLFHFSCIWTMYLFQEITACNLLSCHFLIQGKLMPLCYMPVKHNPFICPNLGRNTKQGFFLYIWCCLSCASFLGANQNLIDFYLGELFSVYEYQ